MKYITGFKIIIAVWWFEYAWPKGSGTVRRCSLVGGSVTVGVACRGFLLCSGSTYCRTGLLLAAFSSRCRTISSSSWHHVCLHAAMLPVMIIMVCISETVSQPHLNVCLYKSCHGHSVSLQQLNPK